MVKKFHYYDKLHVWQPVAFQLSQVMTERKLDDDIADHDEKLWHHHRLGFDMLFINFVTSDKLSSLDIDKKWTLWAIFLHGSMDAACV